MLAAAKAMFAQELAFDPNARRVARQYWQDNAIMTIRLMQIGMSAIAGDHAFYPFKFVTGKPLSKLREGEILGIRQAESQGLLDVKFERVHRDGLNRILANAMLDPSARTEHAMQWNAVRRDIVEEIAEKWLVDIQTSFVRAYYREEAETLVAIMASKKALSRKLSVGPYRSRSMKFGERPLVMVATQGTEGSTRHG